jgi:hypothetical protein
MSAVAPLARLPSRTVTVPPLPGDGVVAVPWLVDALSNVVPAGTSLVTTTPVAVAGPAFLIVAEYVKLCPGDTFIDDAERLMLTSAED